MKRNTLTEADLRTILIDNPETTRTNAFDRAMQYGFTASAALKSQLWEAVTGKPSSRAAKQDKFWHAAQRQPEPIPAGIQIGPEPEDIPPVVKPTIAGHVQSSDYRRQQLAGNRFVFTAAQNNTALHEGFWASLQRFCDYNGAQLGIAQFTYNKNGFQKVTTDSEGLWYDPRILPFVATESTKVADGLVFCAELDIIPTAAMPLSGLDDYTGRNSGIIPHAKMQLKSLATMKHEPAKMLYTTGAITLRNYIQRRAGQVADFHHVFGALYVEIDEEGDWFCRQLNASDDGSFYDLGLLYTPDTVETGRPPMLNLGDIHIEKADLEAVSGALDIMKELRPTNVFLHDLIDFEARNHHNKKDVHFLVDQHWNRDPSVEAGINAAAKFLSALVDQFPGMNVTVIRSNHDNAFKQWLRDGSGFIDPVNEYYWHRMNSQLLGMIRYGDSGYDIFQYAMNCAAVSISGKAQANVDCVQFVKEDESYSALGIEFGMHGHLGVNGAKGSPGSFRQTGRKANTGHTHSAGIIGGIYTAGVLGKLDMGYNKGPSSWSHSHILTYPNGKRCIITQRGRKWRA